MDLTMSLEQLQCIEDDRQYYQSISKSTQQQSYQSIATLQSDQSIESLEKLVSQEIVKDSNLKLELDQFIGLLQKVKPSNLKNELSVVMSTEQEEYYSFQQKQPLDRKEIMFEGFQKCYVEAIKIISNLVRDSKEQNYIISYLEKMQMIYIMHIQSYQGMEKSMNLLNSLKQTLIDADQEITLLHNQTAEQQQILQKMQLQLKQSMSELNQERLNSLDLQQEDLAIKTLDFEKLLQTEQELNEIVSTQSQQIKQLVQTNKNLREAIVFDDKRQDNPKRVNCSPLNSQRNTVNSNQENQYNQLNNQLTLNINTQRANNIDKGITNTSPQQSQRCQSNKREWNKCTKVFK
ncbi:unnamed protein product (macronuclear) [Paramecium tetraurelia]|uniref:Uncharacterized protein n=1 Tax=Paramecium tetraurelia TaxID=5888 RepID=A0BSL0_PARTE|nr:uncharacterized protein GSPATT00031759001 [Paramecium tetraurelia]CAK61527.1 unnamed protein product [Paramecium tetraurelia]|eukprot:XP_001428925.1 hypothetical protein (macronuclear) [Paramecium tetraurelia strain d4-2]